MVLSASCSRCPSPVQREGSGYRCSVHGATYPLWRPEIADYESFAEVIGHYEDVPTYLPWPMSPGWSIADFGCVTAEADPDSAVLATVTGTVGTSDLDGPVEVTVVSEDPGIGLGARCARSPHVDPGDRVGRGAAAVHVRAGGRQVQLWAVDSPNDEDPLVRSVFVGEADGRWLWLVLRPAAAALLLHDEWLLADVTGFGPEALEMPFGGPRPRW